MKQNQLESIQVKPFSFVENSFKLKHVFNKPISNCWDIFNHSKTFTKNQIFPFKVEFCPENTQTDNHFHENVWTNHHGPLLNVAGQITKMQKPDYRDLHYCYGSYVLSFRLIRPVRLQFYFEALDSKTTTVRVQLDCYVKPWFNKIWSMVQYIFWKPFFLSINLSIKK